MIAVKCVKQILMSSLRKEKGIILMNGQPETQILNRF